jgi:hypothetical protein
MFFFLKKKTPLQLFNPPSPQCLYIFNWLICDIILTVSLFELGKNLLVSNIPLKCRQWWHWLRLIVGSGIRVNLFE